MTFVQEPTHASMSPGLLRRLDALEQEDASHGAYTGVSRWMIPYADVLTLLMGLFLVLYSLSAPKTDAHKTTETPAASVQKLERTKPKNTPAPKAPKKDPKSIQPSEEAKRMMAAFNQPFLKKQGVLVSQDARGIVLSFRDSALFPPGQAELTPTARKTLDKLSVILQDLSRPIRVEGHTDNTPIATSHYPSNWELSTARATHIVKYLVTKHHLSPQTLSAAGYGEFRPVSENSTIEGKQKNRRVDIVVLNNQAERQEPGFAPEPTTRFR